MVRNTPFIQSSINNHVLIMTDQREKVLELKSMLVSRLSCLNIQNLWMLSRGKKFLWLLQHSVQRLCTVKQIAMSFQKLNTVSMPCRMTSSTLLVRELLVTSLSKILLLNMESIHAWLKSQVKISLVFNFQPHFPSMRKFMLFQ